MSIETLAGTRYDVFDSCQIVARTSASVRLRWQSGAGAASDHTAAAIQVTPPTCYLFHLIAYATKRNMWWPAVACGYLTAWVWAAEVATDDSRQCRHTRDLALVNRNWDFVILVLGGLLIR